MKIILATPLFPPDIGGGASYTKELAKQLAKYYEVTIVTYGHIPEKVPGVAFACTDKRSTLIIRLFRYTISLLKQAKTADVLYLGNGASVELPALLVALFTQCKIVLHIADKQAHKKAQGDALLKYIERFIMKRASTIIYDTPPRRPEILPFKDNEIERKETDSYEISWSTHINTLKKIFEHGRKK